MPPSPVSSHHQPPSARIFQLIFIDCGQLTGDEAKNIGKGKNELDSTGDAYEDFPEDQGEEFKGPQILEIATKLKEYGNKAFKSGNLNLALEKYLKGLRYLHEYPEVLPEDPAELSTELTKIRFTLHSNSALLQIKLGSFEDAKSSADNALEIKDAGLVPDQDRAKALYRKGLALRGLKDDEEAVKNLEKAHQLAPGDSAITNTLQDAKRKAAEQAKKEKAAYSKFFS